MATVDQTTLRQNLRQFVIDTFLVGDEAENLGDADSFMQNGYIDSTGILELTQYIETTYSFTIDDEEMIPTNLDTIDNLVNFVVRKTGG